MGRSVPNEARHRRDRTELKKLARYREAAGPDIRLLLVADRICNSGKLMLDEGTALDVQGFQVVYFFSYPESVTIFDCTGNIA